MSLKYFNPSEGPSPDLLIIKPKSSRVGVLLQKVVQCVPSLQSRVCAAVSADAALLQAGSGCRSAGGILGAARASAKLARFSLGVGRTPWRGTSVPRGPKQQVKGLF